MNYRILFIIGIIVMVIGIAGAMYTGDIVVKEYSQATEFMPATIQGFKGTSPYLEIGFIAVAIFGLALLSHGFVNDPKKELRTTSKGYRQ